jgi:hypothetical protein
VSLAAGAAFMLMPRTVPAWLNVAGFLVLFAVVVGLVLRWSAATGWGDAHRLALAGGGLLTYAWHAFPQPPVVPTPAAVDLLGNAVFALAAVVLLVVAARRLRRAPEPVRGEPAPAEATGNLSR